MITPRHASLSTSPPAASPPSPTLSSPTSPPSRRSSVHVLSPTRSYVPLSPASRAPRSSLSAAMAIPMPSPFPAPPPPNESIKRQRVPESVRSAMDFRTASGPSYADDALGGPSSIAGGSFLGLSSGEITVPKTPQGTRAPSPASESPSASEGKRSQGPSKDSSATSSRRGSAEKGITSPPLASPVFIPGHTSSALGSSSSAFSPLFPFPSSPSTSASPRARDRARSVYVPSSSADPFRNAIASSSKPSKHHDFAISPHNRGSSPLSLPGTSRIPTQSISPTDLTTTRGDVSANRTSSIPVVSSALPESTDEYAQIILASRSAKMRKWKASNPTTSTAVYDPSTWESSDYVSRRPIPNFGEGEGVTNEGGEVDLDAVGGSGKKEVEWVDWLDEYRKMKEAKLKAEEVDKSPSKRRPFTAEDKGKGRAGLGESLVFPARSLRDIDAT